MPTPPRVPQPHPRSRATPSSPVAPPSASSPPAPRPSRRRLSPRPASARPSSASTSAPAPRRTPWAPPGPDPKFPRLTVTIEPFPGGKYQTKIVALMAASSLGDTLWGKQRPEPVLQEWAHLGGVRAVDDLVRTKLDLAQWYKQAVDGGKLEGKLYGLPFKLHPSFCVIYYNVNAVRELGQALPDANTTWEQTLDLGRRLKKTDGGASAR